MSRKKPRTVYISGSWLVGREPKMGYGQQGGKKNNAKCEYNATLLKKMLPISFVADVNCWKPQTKLYKVEDALRKIKPHASVLFDLHRL